MSLPVATPTSLKETIQEDEDDIKSQDDVLSQIIDLRIFHSEDHYQRGRLEAYNQTLEAHKQDTENFHLPTFLGNKIELEEQKIIKNEQTLEEKHQPSAIPVYKRLIDSARKINKIFSNDNNGPSMQEGVSYSINSGFRNKYSRSKPCMQQGVSYSVNYSSEKDTRKLRISRAIKMNNPSTPRPSMAPCAGPIVPPHHIFQISKAPSLRSGFSTQDKEEEKDNDIQ